MLTRPSVVPRRAFRPIAQSRIFFCRVLAGNPVPQPRLVAAIHPQALASHGITTDLPDCRGRQHYCGTDPAWLRTYGMFAVVCQELSRGTFHVPACNIGKNPGTRKVKNLTYRLTLDQVCRFSGERYLAKQEPNICNNESILRASCWHNSCFQSFDSYLLPPHCTQNARC